MHNRTRTLLGAALVVVSCGAVCGGAYLGTLLSLEEARDQTKADLRNAIDDAVVGYKERSGIQSSIEQAQRDADAHRSRAAELQRKNREMRFQIAALQDRAAALQQKYHVPSDAPSIERFLASGEEALTVFLRKAYVDRLRVTPSSDLTLLGSAIAGTDYGDAAEHGLHLSSVQETLMSYVDSVAATRDMADELKDLAAKRAAVLDEIVAEERAEQEAIASAKDGEERLALIQQEVEEVHKQVLALQTHLGDINDIMLRRTEEKLIAKGLLDPSERGTTSHAAAPLFIWPVQGKLTAGFQDASYKSFFGVPHHGQDIAVPQGTVVHASSDGVVFIVRDGGKTGYTYVLIGHANGFATLYGHLSSVNVTAGQEVSAGDPIGLSGGEPGTHGAGPMTTGAHVHFEVIKDGENIDPKSVIEF